MWPQTPINRLLVSSSDIKEEPSQRSAAASGQRASGSGREGRLSGIQTADSTPESETAMAGAPDVRFNKEALKCDASSNNKTWLSHTTILQGTAMRLNILLNTSFRTRSKILPKTLTLEFRMLS